jgi:hypothetical protein
MSKPPRLADALSRQAPSGAEIERDGGREAIVDEKRDGLGDFPDASGPRDQRRAAGGLEHPGGPIEPPQAVDAARRKNIDAERLASFRKTGREALFLLPLGGQAAHISGHDTTHVDRNSLRSSPHKPS